MKQENLSIHPSVTVKLNSRSHFLTADQISHILLMLRRLTTGVTRRSLDAKPRSVTSAQESHIQRDPQRERIFKKRSFQLERNDQLTAKHPNSEHSRNKSAPLGAISIRLTPSITSATSTSRRRTGAQRGGESGRHSPDGTERRGALRR